MAQIIPVFPVPDVAAALAWYTERLGFTEHMRMPGPDGVLVTGRVGRGGVSIMFNHSPSAAGAGDVWTWLYLDDVGVDELHAAIAGGVTVVDPPRDQFWGDRSFTIRDLNGYTLVFAQVLDAAHKAAFDRAQAAR